MSDHAFILRRFSVVFPVSPALLTRARAFKEAVDAALLIVTAEQLVAEVVAMGPLTGARNPVAVLIARVRAIPENHSLDAQVATDQAEASFFRRQGSAGSRGQTVGDLVKDGTLELDEAERLLSLEFPDESLLAVALDGLRGRLR